MTAQLEHPVTTNEMRLFEAFDAENPDFNAEMIDGEVYFNTVVTHTHGHLVVVIAAQLLAKWCVTTEVDTVYEGWHGTTLLRPDLSVSDPSYRSSSLDQFPADEILLVVEVTSRSNPENDTVKKVRKYAEAGIPYYLIVNAIEGKCLLYSDPKDDRYRGSAESEFGEPVSIGAPINTDLDTSTFSTY
ncbi:Uma2 family endonuclease [Streptomyces sp. NPDC051162]|uniref:Uma2 family endonuclease n=1 Tax=Streptomyces sp. NPDC051162 TaxID=3154747 RepID=UPI0034432266